MFEHCRSAFEIGRRIDADGLCRRQHHADLIPMLDGAQHIHGFGCFERSRFQIREFAKEFRSERNDAELLESLANRLALKI